MASIKDIAKACGVSVATVSKALNGHNDISQATKEKVREAARQIGYMPNSAARALKTNRTYNLGVLFVDEAQSGLTHEFFAAVLDSFKRHAEGRGYDITFINHNIGHGHSSYLEHCRYRGVDGVIAACIKFDDPEVIELANSNLPIVTVDHVFNNRAAVLSLNVHQQLEGLFFGRLLLIRLVFRLTLQHSFDFFLAIAGAQSSEPNKAFLSLALHRRVLATLHLVALLL